MAKTLEELTTEVQQLQERVDYLEQQMRFSVPVTPQKIVSLSEPEHVDPPGHRQTAAGHVREDSPYHLDIIDSTGTYTNGMLLSCAIIRAAVVFPTPGGPSNSTARGMFDSGFFLVSCITELYVSGFFRGRITDSRIFRFASVYPAM